MAFVAIVAAPGTDIQDGLLAIFHFPTFSILPADVINTELDRVTPTVWVDAVPGRTARVRIGVAYNDNREVPSWGMPGVLSYAVHKCVQPTLHSRMSSGGNYRTLRAVWGRIPDSVRAVADAHNSTLRDNARQQAGYEDRGERPMQRTHDQLVDGEATGAYDERYFPIDGDASGLDPRHFPGGNASAQLLNDQERYRPVEPEKMGHVDFFP